MLKNLQLAPYFFLWCFYGVFAQDKVSVSGQLLDATSQKSLPFVNVAVHTFE
ncbi:hypothetical protein LCGC14_1214550, partial [marine sediment metagenome]